MKHHLINIRNGFLIILALALVAGILGGVLALVRIVFSLNVFIGFIIALLTVISCWALGELFR